ncbi:MAG: UPF0158 family protein [Pseudomonas sp.]
MRPLTIDLLRIEQALDSREDLEHYLDLETGAILAIAPGEPAPGAAEKYQVQPDRYLLIEPLALAETLAMREAFLFTQHDPHAHAALSQALAGRKPLRTFGYALESFPQVRQAWLEYQAAQLRDYALEWLQANGLEAARRD